MVWAHHQIHIATLAAIAAGRASARHKLLTAKGDDAVPAVTAFYIDLRLISKHAFAIRFRYRPGLGYEWPNNSRCRPNQSVSSAMRLMKSMLMALISLSTE